LAQSEYPKPANKPSPAEARTQVIDVVVLTTYQYKYLGDEPVQECCSKFKLVDATSVLLMPRNVYHWSGQRFWPKKHAGSSRQARAICHSTTLELAEKRDFWGILCNYDFCKLFRRIFLFPVVGEQFFEFAGGIFCQSLILEQDM
jgi:hypothetical protein